MATTHDGASLAHLADTVTALAARVADQAEVQRNILAVLNELLETGRAQSEMLADILGAASQEAGPSPVADALEALAAQVGSMEETQTGLVGLVTALPEAIGRQFEISLKDWPGAAGTKH
jgi:uncharacterized iron-regulated protein